MWYHYNTVSITISYRSLSLPISLSLAVHVIVHLYSLPSFHVMYAPIDPTPVNRCTCVAVESS